MRDKLIKTVILVCLVTVSVPVAGCGDTSKDSTESAVSSGTVLADNSEPVIIVEDNTEVEE